jgi:hypothetical protein
MFLSYSCLVFLGTSPPRSLLPLFLLFDVVKNEHQLQDSSGKKVLISNSAAFNFPFRIAGFMWYWWARFETPYLLSVFVWIGQVVKFPSN